MIDTVVDGETTTHKAKGNPSRGRVLFDKLCGQCHKLYDVGGDVGPELTGSNRADPEYILQNMVDPNALIGRDYLGFRVVTKDDRYITGLLRKKDKTSVTIQTANETLIIPQSEIEWMKRSEISMMPTGLLDGLKPNEIRDLVSYLRTEEQVPLPPEDK